MKFLTLLFLLVCTYADLKCDTFKCGESLEAEPCLQRIIKDSHFEYSLKSCSEGKSCQINENLDKGTCVQYMPSKYPGEYCTNKAECLSGNCSSNKVCHGLNESSKCNNDHECDYGLYCHREDGEEKCTAVIKISKTCTLKNRCDAGLVCNNGICVVIGSIEEEKEANIGSACKTFYSNGTHCIKGPTLVGSKTECNENCLYIVEATNKSFNKPCVCGMSESPKKYCSPGIGNLSIEDVLF